MLLYRFIKLKVYDYATGQRFREDKVIHNQSLTK